MAKPLPRRIPSDSCAVTDQETGAIYYPHEGEWAEIIVGQTVGELQALDGMRHLQTEIQAVIGDPDEGGKVLALLAPHARTISDLLAARVVDWNWTDDTGRALPAIDGTTLPFQRLRLEELYWLLTTRQGESPDERKNGSALSPITSSVTESPATAGVPSTMARSHMKAS